MFSKYPEEKTIDTNNYKSITSRVPAQPRRTHTQSFAACQYPSTSTPRADITIRASVHRVCTKKKTVKKTVRSNCNPDLLSASFGPSQRLHISVHHAHTYTYIYTRVAQPHDLLLFGGAYWVRCFLPLSSAKLPRPWTLPTRPPFTFSPSPREQRTTLRATRHRVTLSLSLHPTGESGLGFSSTFFRPKQHRSSFYEEEAGKETFLFQRENCNAVKSGRARVEKALEREEKKGYRKTLIANHRWTETLF